MKRAIFVVLCVLGVSSLAFAAPEPARQVRFDIPAQSLLSALYQFSTQAKVQIVTKAADVSGATTKGVIGLRSIGDGAEELLKETGFSFEVVDDTTIAITVAGAGKIALERAPAAGLLRLAQADAKTASSVPQPSAEESATSQKGVLEILVAGSRILNTDIERTRDDAQPYVVFNRETIEKSGAPNLEEFFRKRLTMSVSSNSSGQDRVSSRGLSRINLRGLGLDQTLILVDGRRVVAPAFQGIPFQPDVNQIPLSAIERVEVLPTTSSGIYGGSATGGVVNIILRRDYQGAEVNLTYDNSFDTDSALRRMDVGVGFSLEEGRTNVLLGGSVLEGNALALGDRDFYQRGVSRILANSPGLYLNSATPPLGSTTNIRSSNGSNLVLKDGTPLNSPITFVPLGYQGPASDGGAALVGNAGRYNLALADSGQAANPVSALALGGALSPLVASARSESFMAMVRREFTPWLQGYLDLAAANSYQGANFAAAGTYSLSAASPLNPFQQAISVRVPTNEITQSDGTDLENRRASLGVIVKLPAKWMAAADFSIGRSLLDQKANPPASSAAVNAAVEAGAINVMRDPATGAMGFELNNFTPVYFDPPAVTQMQAGAVRFSGPIFQLPAGPVILSTALERRRDETDASTLFGLTGSPPLLLPARHQVMNSGYIEAIVPVLAEAKWAKELSLQLAFRAEQSKVQGSNSFVAPGSPVVSAMNKNSSQDPTVAIRYRPVSDVILRASYGTGFLAPNVNQLVASVTTNVVGPIDPLRGNVTGPSYIAVSGGNPNLIPEKSTSWSSGVVYTPSSLPGLRLSLDYIKINKRDNILSNISVQNIVNLEQFFPGRITRGPVLPGDPYSVGPITQVDFTAMNVARTRLEAWDMAVEYSWPSAYGTFDLSMAATYNSRYDTRLLPNVDWASAVGIANFAGVGGQNGAVILKRRSNATVSWTRDALTLGWSVNFYDSYLPLDPSAAANIARLAAHGDDWTVPAQWFHDLNASYDFDRRGGAKSRWLDGLALSLGIRNVLGTQPQFDVGNGHSYASLFGDPRLRTGYVSLKKRF